jgi:hypothetical protein
MKHIAVLETEYKEQYNQYRWIGQMQAGILTFYGVVATVAMLAVAALRPQPPTPIDLRWPGGVMVGVGFLGILVGYGLFRSRTMQRRTALYLKSLLVQMARETEDASSVNDSALRFRSLCDTRGRFKMWDTMNIAILIAFYSGEAFIITGGVVLLVVWNVLCPITAVVIGLTCMIILLALTPVLVQRFLMDKETALIEADYRNVCKIQRLEQIGELFGLPKEGQVQ